MNTVTIVLLVILIILIGLLIGLYFFGKRAQRRQEEQQAQIQAMKQTISMLVIDKKRLPVKDSGLPQMVIDQTPKLMRRSKLPIVKAKIGPRIQVLIADEKVYDLIPVKKEIKAEVSGLYIVGVKGLRGSLEAPVQKKGFFARMRAKAAETLERNSQASGSKNTKQGSSRTSARTSASKPSAAASSSGASASGTKAKTTKKSGKKSSGKK